MLALISPLKIIKAGKVMADGGMKIIFKLKHFVIPPFIFCVCILLLVSQQNGGICLGEAESSLSK
jgi:hypothetical protein